MVDGIELRFHLAGINNQNFLMRDEQTGTYWQQITGRAIAGPLAGRRLVLVPADDVTFGLWRAEQPNGTVLNDVSAYVADYAPENWDVRMAKAPTVISYAQAGIRARDLMIGIHASGASRAIPFTAVLREKLIQDRIGHEPVVILLGVDNQSVRVFKRRIPSISEIPDFYRIADTSRDSGKGAAVSAALMMDSPTGSYWNFKGCAISGKLEGVCLERVVAIKDYWFDWRNYNPQTTVYGIHQKIR